MAESLENFFSLSLEAFESLVRTMGQPRYRANQIWAWVYRQLASDFSQMANVPSTLRSALSAHYTLTPAQSLAIQNDAQSEATKALLRLADGKTIECVLMNEPHGHTVCVSTQVGCPLECAFCATGQAGFERNLSAGEIVYQVIHFSRLLKLENPDYKVDNIVFMGMGEPLLNYEATLQAIAHFCDPYGMAMSPQRLTISTAGLPEAILALSRQSYNVRLAISLHAANPELRAQLMPKAGKIPLPKLIQACREYSRSKDQRITFEYIMLKNINDSEQDAHALISLIGDFPSHVNLIPLNATSCTGAMQPSSNEAIMQFRATLQSSRIPCTVRYSHGTNIAAGCGQLRGSTVL